MCKILGLGFRIWVYWESRGLNAGAFWVGKNTMLLEFCEGSVRLDPYPKDQNSPKALYSMVFGPKRFNI